MPKSSSFVSSLSVSAAPVIDTAGVPLVEDGAPAPPTPAPNCSNGTPAEMTLAEVRAAIADIRAKHAEASQRFSAAVLGAEAAEQEAQAMVRRVHTERGNLARWERAKKDHETQQDECVANAKRRGQKWERRVFRYDGCDPLLVSQIDELQAAIPGLLTTANLTRDAATGRPASIAQQCSVFVPVLEALGQDALTELTALRARMHVIQVTLRTSRDADELIAARREGDEMPLRLALAELKQVEVELCLLEIYPNPRNTRGGFAGIGALQARKQELEEQLVSQARGSNVRSVMHLNR